MRASSLLSASRLLRLPPLASALLLAILLPVVGRAQNFSVVHRFNLDADTGAHPVAALIQSYADSHFYGTTARGGYSNNGTVFRLNDDGTTTTLYEFNGGNHGGEPVAALAGGATDGLFYGTTQYGGYYDEGTAFVITAGGTLTTLFDFGGDYGGQPVAALTVGPDNNLYGTTQYGGYYDQGTVFKMTRGGDVTILFDFGGDYGAQPLAGLTLAADGNFYGTTSAGGYDDQGTVFQITPAGMLTVLHDFDGRDGSYPEGGLSLANDGTLYGTTTNGGQDDYGTVFSITTAGAFTSLHQFDGRDGSHPQAAPVQGADGSFYGTTFYGGQTDHGTLYRVTTDGGFASIFSFDDPVGTLPAAALVKSFAGPLYGTTTRGGGNDDGVVYRISGIDTPPIQDVLFEQVSARVTGSASVKESGGVARIIVTRAFPEASTLNTPLTVNYQLKGTAVNGVDYQTLSGSVTIPAGKTKARIEIVPIDRGLPAGGSRKVTVKLLDGNGEYDLSKPKKATVFILDGQ